MMAKRTRNDVLIQEGLDESVGLASLAVQQVRVTKVPRANSCDNMAQYNTGLLVYKTEVKTDGNMGEFTDKISEVRQEKMEIVLTQVYRTCLLLVLAGLVLCIWWGLSAIKQHLTKLRIDDGRLLRRSLEVNYATETNWKEKAPHLIPNRSPHATSNYPQPTSIEIQV